MIEFDEQALICDLAETYHILDYRSLPLMMVATLSAGLRENSRIKVKASEYKVPLDSVLLALIADRIGSLISCKNEMPITNGLLKEPIKKESQNKSFGSSIEFEAMWLDINGGD